MKTQLGTTVALLALGAAACAKDAAPPAPVATSRPVRVVPISDTAATPMILASGTVGARDELVLSFKIGGVIAAVTVDEGDRVRAGQVLATIAMPEIDASVSKADAALAKAERDAARVRRLAADSVATRTQVDDAETALQVARADDESARFNRRYAVITAPAAGTVMRRMGRAGELVSPGAPVLTLASAGRGTVFRASVADRDLVRLAEGDVATVRLDAYPGRTFRATVLEKGAAPAAMTGAYVVTLALPEASGLPSGLVGQASMATRSGERVRLVPMEALVEADGLAGTVFVLGADSTRVERRRVTIAFVGERQLGIASGLEGAGVVVTDGAPYLRDGETVRVTP
jgi:RND family efflux transporter MFP subunit